MDKCKDCKWWEDASELKNGLGKCRRYPPHSGAELDRLPVVNEEERCGEFKADPELLLARPIEDLEWPYVTKRLSRHGITTIGQLVEMSRNDLRSLKEGLSGEFWGEIKDVLEKRYGIRHRDKERAEAAVREALGIDNG